MKKALRGAATLALVAGSLAQPFTATPAHAAVNVNSICGAGTWKLAAQKKFVNGALSATVAAWRSGTTVCAATINNTGTTRPTFINLSGNGVLRGRDWGDYRYYAGGVKYHFATHTRIDIVGAVYQDRTQKVAAGGYATTFWV